jgi:hypothetical protein
MGVLSESLKSVHTTYEFSPEEMKFLIAADLKVSPERVSVQYVITEVGGDPLDRYRGTDQVTKIRVTVK